MSTISSTLKIAVDDAGLVSKLKADAAALKNFGTSASRIKATAGGADLIRQFEKLQATAGRVDAYQDARRALQNLGAGHRQARQEVDRTTAALARAQKRKEFFDRSKANNSPNYPAFKASGMVAEADAALRRAARAHTAATRTFGRTQEAFTDQKTTVRALGQELERAGHPLHQMAQVQAGLRTKMEQTTAAIRRQATAHEDARVAAVASSAERTRQANAQLRATVAGGQATHRERQADAALTASQARRDNRNAIRAAVQQGQQLRRSRETAEGEEASRRQNAVRDMARGMGSAGRRQSADIEGGRRVADGMSTDARNARATAKAAAEVAEVQRIERIETARNETKQARKLLAGGAGLALGHKVHEGTEATLHTYREYDKERRFGGVVMGLNDEQQQPLVDQAIHMGATSKYNDVKVLEAQRELAARGLTKEQVLGMIPAAKDLGQATDLGLPEAVRQIEGGIFGFKKDTSTTDAAARSARQTADVQVAAAKASGMTPDDIRQTYTYAATPARLAGVSEQKMLAFGAIGKKSNMDGQQMGTAWRALISAATAPTRKAKETMSANDIDYSSFQKAPDSLNLEGFERNVRSSYGVRLNDDAREKLGKIFTDKDLIKDASKFTPAVMDVLGESLGKKDAKSKQSIAGMANRYRDASMQGVDVDRLIGVLLEKLPGNIAMANALFGSKQGSRIASAYGDPETYKKILDILVNHSEGKASTVSEARMAGYDGAQSRFEGAKTNLESAVGRSLDDNGKGGVLTSLTNAAANATQSLAELPNSVIAVGASATWLAGKLATTFGTAALLGASTGISAGIVAGKGGAMLATAGAAAGVLAPAVLTAAVTAPLIMADKSKGIVHGGRNVGAAQMNPSDELPGLSGSDEAPSWTRPALRGSLPPGEYGMPKPAPARLPGLDGRVKPQADARPAGFGPATTAVPDAGKVQEATAALSAYRTELAAVKNELAAAPTLDVPGVSSGLEARKAQLEHMITGVQTQIKALSGETITPQVETSALDRLHTRAEEARVGLEKVGATKVDPQVGTGGLDALIAKAAEAVAALLRVQSMSAGANASIASVNAASRLQGRGSSASFSDGVTPGAGAQ
jgi:TP901 family phage tail tape measure protein